MYCVCDIYFISQYGRLYEKAEKGEARCWKYDGKEGKVSHQFLYRSIPLETEESWYDIVTPYGYGGPIIEKVNEGFTKSDLILAFEKAFGKYCEENRIVSEFVRFHPLTNNGQEFASVYNSEHIRNTLGTNLGAYDDPVANEFSKSCRKTVRQAINKGVSWRITKAPDSLEVFKQIYYATMDRNEASDYYYFDDAYFENCIKWFRENLLLVEAVFEEKTIAAGMYFLYEDKIHVHLSGTLSEYLFLSPAYILKYATALWGKENGYRIIHYGGGRTSSQEDALYLFKKKFSLNTEFQFFVGKKIWNEKIYKELCNFVGVEKSNFFPMYRIK